LIAIHEKNAHIDNFEKIKIIVIAMVQDSVTKISGILNEE